MAKKKNDYGHIKAGWCTIGGKRNYYRSEFERNYAFKLQDDKNKGIILDWEHEPKEFWFLKIKRGIRSYKPDFMVTRLDGSIFWIETKGYLDTKSKTKIKRFKKYYPDEEFKLIMQKS